MAINALEWKRSPMEARCDERRTRGCLWRVRSRRRAPLEYQRAASRAPFPVCPARPPPKPHRDSARCRLCKQKLWCGANGQYYTTVCACERANTLNVKTTIKQKEK